MCTDGRRCENCPARRVTAGAAVIAAALPALGTVVAATTNDAALLSHTGEYLPGSLPGGALHGDDAAIAVRLHPALIRDVHLTDRALTLSDGASTHRAYLTPMSDRLAVEALTLAPAEKPITTTPLDWSSVSWGETDLITHLDSLTAERYRVLPFTGARAVDPRVVPHLLAYLGETELPFTAAVPGGGCVQVHRGRAAAVQHAGTHVAVVFGASRYALDPHHIAECWVTRSYGTAGPTSSVELYDHSRRCVTVLTQSGPFCGRVYEAWEAIAASLPQSRP